MRSLQGRLCHCNSLRRETKEKKNRSERLRQRKAQEEREECGGKREKKENERGQPVD